ncbi:MAG: methyltransferase domain-containing protein [Verrucomicrobiota bacterium]|nr:methyltransferase domain-containing protein [Limisphaera sp.]MDW8381062.1 methyltransferase domain-containing protein [Verrucomicrobiota bacterium]
MKTVATETMETSNSSGHIGGSSGPRPGAEWTGFLQGLSAFLEANVIHVLQWDEADSICFSRWTGAGDGNVALQETRVISTTGLPWPLPAGGCDVLVLMGWPGEAEDSQARSWLAELRRLTNCAVWLSFRCASEAELFRREQEAFDCGFRKHPLMAALRPFGGPLLQDGVAVLLLEKIPEAALAADPLQRLRLERDLHMDMLREAGLRAEAHLARYEWARQQLRPGMVVLDAACGLGYGSAILACKTGVAQVLGVDRSPWVVEYAQLHYGVRHARLRFREADVQDLAFLPDGCVDAVVSFETLEHVPNPERALREFCRVLRPGGFFMGSVPNLWVDEQGRNPLPQHLHVYDYELFHDQVARHFRWRALLRQNAGGGWKPREWIGIQAVAVDNPDEAARRDAEWWIALAEKPGANVSATASEGSSKPDGAKVRSEVRQSGSFANSTRVILATNYLLWTPATRWMWERLGQELERQGCQLVLLSTTLPEPAMSFPVSLHPYLLRDVAQQFPGWTAEADLSATKSELHWLRADISRVATGYTLEQALQGLAAFRRYARGLLEHLRPNFLLLGDDTLAQTALFRRLAWDQHLPVLIYERGLLPDTLMIESRGIQAWSDARTHWLAQEIPPLNPERFAEIQRYYLTRRPQKYPQPDSPGGAADIRSRLGLGRRKLVVFLGGGYEANGHSPKGGIRDRFFFPGFSTTEETLLALWRAVEPRSRDVALVFKPHPLDPNPYVVATIEGIPILREVNVHALIEAADVVAAQFTTLQFEAVLFDKPVLLLARSAWWGRQATYEVESPDLLERRLEESLQQDQWPEIQARARQFVTWLMDTYLVGAGPEVPARRNLSDLAAYIARLAVDARGMLPAGQRWERCRCWLEEHQARSGGWRA